MSSTMGLIGPERVELFTLEIKELLYFTLHATIYKYHQAAPNLVNVYNTIRSRMSLIMGLIGLEQLESSANE